MKTYTAHATTFDKTDLQYEYRNGFQPYKGDAEHFNSYDEAMEAAKEEQSKFDSIIKIWVEEHEIESED